ncbi:hypothetical protein GCM10029992_54540 [Glycomyces albus]
MLYRSVRERMAEAHPLARYRTLRRPPVLGAAWAALDVLTGRFAGPAHRRLAAQLAEREPLAV